jgi:trk system potassium uptake protein TrkA
MNIIISGVGDVGKYLAKMLNQENHDITIIDMDVELLKEVDATCDLMSISGSCTSFNTLKEAKINNCDLYIAVTNIEDTNILSCILAKKLGAKKCIARVNNMEYLNPFNRIAFINLGIDRLIYPEQIAAKEVVGVLKQTGSADIYEFSKGKLTLLSIKIGEHSQVIDKNIQDIATHTQNKDYRFISIIRDEETIIPRGGDVLKANDIVYIITKPKLIPDLLKYIGVEDFDIKNVMILGGSRIGVKSAQFIENQINVKLLEIDPDKSFKLVDMLPNTMIINGDGRNIDVLLEEELESMDAFVAVTGDSETNILACILAKRYGVKKTIAEVENIDYIDIASKMGIDTIINKKLSTASHIYTFTMKAEVSSIKWLTGTDAEVLEFVTRKDALITKNKLKDITFPEGVIIGGVVRGSKSFIATGDTHIKPNDKVVVFALAPAINNVMKLF